MKFLLFQPLTAKLRLAVGVLCVLTLMLPATASGYDGVLSDDPICETAMSTADSLYIQGDFDNAISLLEYCLDRTTFNPADEVPALLLMAKAHQRRGREMQARAMIGRLLEIDPEYETDPIQETPAFRSLFEQMREEMHRREALADAEEGVTADEQVSQPAPAWRRWLIAGGGAVLAGTAAAVLLSGGGGGTQSGDRWPAPPGRPDN